MLSTEDFIEKLKSLWLAPGKPASTLLEILKDGSAYSVVQDDKIGPVLFKKEKGKWTIIEESERVPLDLEFFYYGDVVGELIATRTIEEFTEKFRDLFVKKRIVVKRMATPAKLVLKGYSRFAKVLGLPK